jgi:hypothetical protein
MSQLCRLKVYLYTVRLNFKHFGICPKPLSQKYSTVQYAQPNTPNHIKQIDRYRTCTVHVVHKQPKNASRHTSSAEVQCTLYRYRYGDFRSYTRRHCDS